MSLLRGAPSNHIVATRAATRFGGGSGVGGGIRTPGAGCGGNRGGRAELGGQVIEGRVYLGRVLGG